MRSDRPQIGQDWKKCTGSPPHTHVLWWNETPGPRRAVYRRRHPTPRSPGMLPEGSQAAPPIDYIAEVIAGVSPLTLPSGRR